MRARPECCAERNKESTELVRRRRRVEAASRLCACSTGRELKVRKVAH